MARRTLRATAKIARQKRSWRRTISVSNKNGKESSKNCCVDGCQQHRPYCILDFYVCLHPYIMNIILLFSDGLLAALIESLG